MVKFRSWNDFRKYFYYFEDGVYKTPTRVFNWQNAEQATGLFDKHGKEIYAGDKVKNSKGETAIVTYHILIGGFTVLFESEGIDKMVGMFDDLEIIGNIHEGEK